MTDIEKFNAGEWVESDVVEKMLDMTFEECMVEFDMARLPEWWSIVGKTEEERQRNGQKITIYFRRKQVTEGMDETYTAMSITNKVE